MTRDLTALALRRSEELQSEVLCFAEADVHEPQRFAELALKIARFQAEFIPGYRALVQAQEKPLDRFEHIPCVFAESFRDATPFAFDKSRAGLCFKTSGTTTALTGRHYQHTGGLYSRLCVRWGRSALVPLAAGSNISQAPLQGSRQHAGGTERFSKTEPRLVVALMQDGGAKPGSSLNFMVQRFMESFDGYSLEQARSSEGFSTRETARWLLDQNGDVRRAALERAIDVAQACEQPILLLATSFALVHLFDALGRERLPLPPGSVVMPTGGFKGRSREVSAREMVQRIHEQLGGPAVVNEYGMTELSSQLYEGTLPGGTLEGPPGVFLEPPWLRVVPLDPATLKPVAEGQPGLACFYDLGNVDSALCVLTQDWVTRERGGIVLHGRKAAAPLRGCSLAVEALWQNGMDSSLPGTEAIEPGHSMADKPQKGIQGCEQAEQAALARVRQLLDQAKQVTSPESELGQRLRRELARSTGLSPEGVELGLSRLETEPREEELCRLCSSAEPAQTAWVVVSANVFVGALRAIALGLASAPRVKVRPSTREATLVQFLAMARPQLFELVEELNPVAGEVVFAYGSDLTLQQIQGALPQGVRFHGHGTGFGAYWLTQPDSLQAACSGLAEDVSIFEQRGCLSPRVVAVDRAIPMEEVLEMTSRALTDAQRRWPLGRLGEEELAERLRFRSSALMRGAEIRDVGGSVVALEHQPETLLLPGSGRHLYVFQHTEPLALLQAYTPWLTSIAAQTRHARHELAQRFPEARVCAPGDMQRPPLDGPVDQRGPSAFAFRQR